MSRDTHSPGARECTLQSRSSALTDMRSPKWSVVKQSMCKERAMDVATPALAAYKRMFGLLT